MSRKICVTAVDGNSGFLIAELILKHREFSRKVSSVVGLTLHPDSSHAKELEDLGVTIVHHVPGRLRVLTRTIKETGCDYADGQKQPRPREFIDLESLVLEAKGDAGTSTGTSPCVIRAGFYAENLLLHAPQAQDKGILPLPISEKHKFTPIALGVYSITLPLH